MYIYTKHIFQPQICFNRFHFFSDQVQIIASYKQTKYEETIMTPCIEQEHEFFHEASKIIYIIIIFRAKEVITYTNLLIPTNLLPMLHLQINQVVELSQENLEKHLRQSEILCKNVGHLNVSCSSFPSRSPFSSSEYCIYKIT